MTKQPRNVILKRNFQKIFKLKPFIYLLWVCSTAQDQIPCAVKNSKNHAPVANALIEFPEGNQATRSDSQGIFFVNFNGKESCKIKVTHEKYLEAHSSLNAKNKPIIIFLEPVSLPVQNQEVVINAVKRKKYKSKKQNPAYAILEKLWQHKRKNGLYLYQNYEFDRYEKIQLDLINIDEKLKKKKIFKNLEFVFKYLDTSKTDKPALPVYLNESVYRVYGQNKPNYQYKEETIANKTAGFQDNILLSETIKNVYRKFNVYDNTLNFFNIAFISPLSTSGFATYDYELIGTSLSKEKTTSYRIRFWPKSEEDFAFKGDMWISGTHFALEKIRMRASKNININFVKNLYLEQEYEIKNDQTFLPKKEYTQLELSFINKRQKDGKGVYVHKNSYYQNFLFDQPVKGSYFYQKAQNHTAKDLKKDDNYWQKARVEKLDDTEAGIYQMLDELQKVPKFRRLVSAGETIISGHYRAGNFSIGNLYNTFGYNPVEGLRLRVGLRTYFGQNDLWRLNSYLAYGFKDRTFKYGLSGKWMIQKPLRWILGAAYKKDIEQLGLQSNLDIDNWLDDTFGASTLFNQSINDKLSKVEALGVFSSIEPFQNIQFGLGASLEEVSTANPASFDMSYRYKNTIHPVAKNFKISTSLLFKPGAKYNSYGLERRLSKVVYHPTIILEYSKGMKIGGGRFDYDQLRMHYDHPVVIPYSGTLTIYFEAGKIFGALPLSLLTPLPGNQSYAVRPGTFAQLDYYEFTTDTFATLHLENHFEGRIFKYIPLLNRLGLREILFARCAWGAISDKNKNLSASKINYRAPSSIPYYEYGFGIENIGYGNFRFFRLDCNWRGNYLNYPDARRFGIKLGVKLSF